MALHPLAGKPAPQSLLINVPELITAYFTRHPDVSNPAQCVAFGTSGHRGVSLQKGFNEDHILAISQAIIHYRIENRANDLLRNSNSGVKRIPYERAIRAGTTHEHDYIKSYVEDLEQI